MESLVFVAVVAAVGVGGWWLGRRRATAPESAPTSGPEELDAPQDPPEPHPFDRDWLLSRSKDFDPSGWDDVTDAGHAAEAAEAADVSDSDPGDLPRHFDREFLERREQGHREPE